MSKVVIQRKKMSGNVFIWFSGISYVTTLDLV